MRHYEIPVYVKTQSRSQDDNVIFRQNPPDILTTEDVAKLLGVSTPTVLRLVEEQALPCKVIGERKRVYGLRSIIDWVNT